VSVSDTIVWRPTCEGCADGRDLLLLGPDPHPCASCGAPTTRALRLVRS
jgi:rRNA maturation endonuclease Nob1